MMDQESGKNQEGTCQSSMVHAEGCGQYHAVGGAHIFCVHHCGPRPSCDKVVIFTLVAQSLFNCHCVLDNYKRVNSGGLVVFVFQPYVRHN